MSSRKLLVDALLRGVDLADRRGVVGQVLLDGDAAELGAERPRELDALAKRHAGAVRAVVRDQQTLLNILGLRPRDAPSPFDLDRIDRAQVTGHEERFAMSVGITALP